MPTTWTADRTSAVIDGTMTHTGQRDLPGGGSHFDEVSGRHRPAWQNTWTATFTCEGRTATFEYFTGCAIAEVSLADALASVLLDAQSYENAASPGDFASEYGIEGVDEALRMWEACKAEGRTLRDLIGSRRYLAWIDAEPEEIARAECADVRYTVNKRWGKWYPVKT